MDYSQLIKEMAPEIAKIFCKASRYQKEADVREDCNSAIQKFVKKADLKIERQNEYSLRKGSIDSKWGDVFIEYKSAKGSGKITEDENAPGTKAVIEQIKSRFIAFVEEAPLFEEEIMQRLFGVGCDGDTIVYVRNISNEWDIRVLPVTAVSVEKLLYALVSVDKAGSRYTPENLANDFGAKSLLAVRCVNALYKTLTKYESAKVDVLFKQWKIHFGEVCGYDIEGNSKAYTDLAKQYNLPEAKPSDLLFAVQTYYAIFMKLLAVEIINAYTGGFSEIKKLEQATDYTQLSEAFKRLEDGGLWKQKGYTNFLEGNIFLWYIDVWNDELAKALREVVRQLDYYDPISLSTNPKESQDLLKKLYHELLPKTVRHSLGEYYTPDWLTEYVIDEVGYDGNPDKRILDPACGSGSFLVQIIKRIREWYSLNRFECGFDSASLVGKIAENVIGIDLNPLAVLAARTNYIIGIRSYLRQIGGIEIPVYLADSISTPAEKEDLFKKQYLYLTIAPFSKPLRIPLDIAGDRKTLAKYANILEECISDYTAEEFIDRCELSGLEIRQNKAHIALFERLQGLHKDNKNGVWARIIKNSFAPLFITQKLVDYVVGNPPWVNWESLPEDYRDKTKDEWIKYGLFSLKGNEARLGGGKKDLSMIFTYSCVDNYLKPGGKLGFVITQSVFKTKGAGDGFRNFFFDSKEGRIYLKPLSVADMSSFQPFYGATNRTAVITLEKTKEKFNYPVDYVIWTDKGKGKISPEEEYDVVMKRTVRDVVSAVPVDKSKLSSPWLTVPNKVMHSIKKVIGESNYKAYAGCTTWLNGVYFVEIVEELPDGNLHIRNLHNVGKKKVERIEAVVEKDFVFPLLRGKDVKRWVSKPECSILMVQDPERRKGIDETELKVNWPKTYNYLVKFRHDLLKRSGYKKYFSTADPFYSIYNVGNYTLSDWKVVWAWLSKSLHITVVCGDKDQIVIPEHNTAFVGLDDKSTAHYICALLGSSIANYTVQSFAVGGGGGLGGVDLLKRVYVPAFDPKDKRHLSLAELSEACHEAAIKGEGKKIKKYELEIDKISAKIWGLTDKELRAIQDVME